MPAINTVNILSSANLTGTGYTLVKIAAIFGMIIYNIFAFIVVRQVNLMTETLTIDLENVVKTIAILHFIFAIGVLIYAIFI
jgi:hypothetical protein